jgi:uncharacterized 2Fe-2S/4Fe-4S cluster protein (DUF4445 family)
MIVDIRLGDESKRTEVEAGKLVDEAVAKAGFVLERQCAGKGTCGKCRVLAEGDLSELTGAETGKLSVEQIEAGYRLACQARIYGAAEITLFPSVVYSNKTFQFTGRSITQGEQLGIAIDLGSTTVGAFLTSLHDGAVYSGSAVLNQQTMFGADVISRLQVADEEKDQLSRLATLSICDAVKGLRLTAGQKSQVVRAVIVGNTAMHHLLLRHPVHTLRVMPFQPLTTGASLAPVGLLSGCLPDTVPVFLPPLIGGFVGSDTLACLLYFQFDRAKEPMLSVDLGTNGEVMLTNGADIVVTSTAAGPAFEGVNIACGTRAVDGAIVASSFRDGKVEVETIGGKPAIGLTGSGLLSVVRNMVEAGIIESSGRMVDEHSEYGSLIRTGGVGKRFMVTETVYLSQKDIRELQNAKAAIRAATEILLSHLNLTSTDLKHVMLTGTFGSKVNVEDVLGLGMIPPVERSIVQSVPNGAGLGAAMFFDEKNKKRGLEIAERTEHIELNMEPDFMDRFVGAMMF